MSGNVEYNGKKFNNRPPEADMARNRHVFAAGVKATPLTDPPEQIHAWNCYVCGHKSVTFEGYITHRCGKVKEN